MFKLNRASLKYLAMVFMLMDHMWATILPGQKWMTCVGRLAFPIFAFQLVEGFIHTSNRKNYKKRLLFFALISEIPFDLMCEGVLFYPFHQNVMFTMLIGIYAMEAGEKMEVLGKNIVQGKQKFSDTLSDIFIQFGIIILCVLLATVGMVDYFAYGIGTIIAFHTFRKNKIMQTLSMVLLYVFLFKGEEINLFNTGIMVMRQSLCILSLPIIWMYDENKPVKHKKLTQQLGYWFYPVHLLILGLPYLFH